MKTRR
jgi:hypothetical protein